MHKNAQNGGILTTVYCGTTQLVIASDGGDSFGIFDADSGKKLQELEGRFLGFSPDSKHIVAGNGNGTVRVHRNCP